MSDTATMQAIAALIPAGARVLDLGCGEGAMLDFLQRQRGCTGYGVELDDANVLACVQRGINVLQLNLALDDLSAATLQPAAVHAAKE